MSYLITGGAGFIGSHLVDFILAEYEDAEVTVLDKLTYAGMTENLESAHEIGRLTFVKGDVCDEQIAAQLCEDADIVIHTAAESHVDRSILSGKIAAQTNFMGTFTMLEAARLAGVQRFLLMSTDEVYGPIAEGEFDESARLNPRNPYSAAKAGADAMARAYFATYQFPVLITRPCNNYGPRQFPEKLVPLFIHKAMTDETLPVYGDGMQVRDWLHVKDHCRATDAVLKRGEAGELYNIAANQERPNLDIIHLILDELDKPESLIEHVDDRPGHDRRYAMDAGKLKNLNWQPQIQWEEGLRETVRWYVENQQWLKTAIQRGENFQQQWYEER